MSQQDGSTGFVGFQPRGACLHQVSPRWLWRQRSGGTSAVRIRSHPERLRHRNRRCRAVHILATKENCLMQDLSAETTRDLFTPHRSRTSYAAEPYCHGAPDPKPRGPRQSAHPAERGQRASAGLIISEATQVAPEGQGYISTPGIYSAEQVAGWKCVTSAVHACSGRMVAQLWHVGRISHPSFQPGGVLPIAPSAIRPNAKAFTANGFEEIPTPRALETSEIPGIVAQYAQGARNALAAGFNGV